MRPIKLTLEAFNSYGGRQEIDFSAFGEEGLFLITGPTGSGKTTIFDGLMYALYGTTCSRDRSSDMVRSLVCDPFAETSATLVFESQGKSYTIKRTPKYYRPAKRGKGQVLCNGTAVLELPDGTSCTRIGEVDEKIKNIVGLDSSQFRQVALLAQGDFRQILTGDTAGRIRILRSLFGTQRYIRLEEKLRDRNQAAQGQLQALSASMKTAIEGIEGYPVQKLEAFDLEEFSRWNQEQKNRLDSLKQSCLQQRKKQDALNQTIGQLEEKKKSWDTWQNALQEIARWQPKLNQLQKEKQEAEARRPEMDQRRLDIERISREMQAGKKRDILERNAQACKKQIIVVKSHLQNDTAQKKALEELQHRQSVELAGMGSLSERMELLKNQKKQLERLDQEEKNLAAARRQVQNQQQCYEKDRQVCLQSQNQEMEARSAYLKGQAGILAQTLSAGSPCPVCGSLSHPDPAVLSTHTPSQKELDALSKKAQKARKAMDDSFETLSKMLQNQQGIQGTLDALRSSIPEDLNLVSVSDQLSRTMQAMQKKADLEAGLKKTTQDLKQIQEALEEGQKKQEQLEQEYSRMQGEISQLLFPYDSMQQAQDLQNQLRRQLDAWLKELESVQEQHQQALQKLSAAQGVIDTLDTGHIEDVSQILQQARSDKAALAAQITQLDTGIQSLMRTISHNQKTEASLLSYEEQYRQQQIVCTELKELYENINGMTNVPNQGKIDLETYVQAAYYENVLNQANLRLMEMSGGRYELQRRSAAKGNSKVGLDLDILDHWSGKVRPASGLSGGESFMASLSLALGLSDAIMQSAGGSVLDTLFVDEGFGSLDSEALDKAVGTLYKLAGNRLVGIISHVDTLQDSIERQIVVSQDKNGRSHAEIAA